MNEVIAFLGLGAMGAEMAGNLREAGYSLRVFNRSPARMQRFVEAGAVACRTPAEAAEGAGFVVSIVADDTATREVMLGKDGVVPAAGAGTIIIDSDRAAGSDLAAIGG